MRKSDVLLMRRAGLAAAGVLTLLAGLAGVYYAITPETIGSVPTPQLGVLLAGLVLPAMTVGAVVLDRHAARRSRAERAYRRAREEAVASWWPEGSPAEGGTKGVCGSVEADLGPLPSGAERVGAAVAGGPSSGAGRRRRHPAGRMTPAGLGG